MSAQASITSSSDSHQVHRRRNLRRIGFRMLAVLLGLVPLVAIELICRLAGWGLPGPYDDPFVGFSATRPLFTLTADRMRYETSPARLSHFRRESFAATKPAGEFRVFCLGGSTVQGRPYSIQTSFTAWLECSLAAGDPSRTFRVVNCGGVSYATYRLVPILEEVLKYQPDLIIFMEGHNEFLEDRTYHQIKHAPAWLVWTQEQALHWRIHNLARSAYLRFRGAQTEPPKPAPVLKPEVDARLDWRGGMEQYRRDRAWLGDCIEHFGFNLRRAIDIARSAGVPLMLVNPPSNLDWPPFKAEHSEGLSEADAAEVERLRDEARANYRDHPSEALRLLKEAVALDPDHAGLMYDLGKCYQKLGLFPQARRALVKAKDADVCPLRILERMNAIELATAAETGTMLVDADALFTEHSAGRINGSEWFVDHVHPTVAGHQLLADAIADELVRHGLFHPVADWPSRRKQAYEEHLAALPATYFPGGEMRLRSEQNWAHGQSRKDRPPK